MTDRIKVGVATVILCIAIFAVSRINAPDGRLTADYFELQVKNENLQYTYVIQQQIIEQQTEEIRQLKDELGHYRTHL